MEFSENEKAPGVLFLAAAEKLKPPLEGAETPNGLLLLVVAGAPNTDDDVVLFAEPNAFEGPLVDGAAATEPNTDADVLLPNTAIERKQSKI